jgi:peptide/nickel transport system ATP-binding protein
MYLGRIVEAGPARAIFASPRHPYTRALLAAAPRATAGAQPAPGREAPPADRGCAFRLRCPLAVARCESERPALLERALGRRVACHRGGEGV